MYKSKGKESARKQTEKQTTAGEIALRKLAPCFGQNSMYEHLQDKFNYTSAETQGWSVPTI